MGNCVARVPNWVQQEMGTPSSEYFTSGWFEEVGTSGREDRLEVSTEPKQEGGEVVVGRVGGII